MWKLEMFNYMIFEMNKKFKIKWYVEKKFLKKNVIICRLKLIVNLFFKNYKYEF